MKIDFSNAKVGDKVWSPEYGKGVVLAEERYLTVTFKLGKKEFTEDFFDDGRKLDGSPHPSLFHSESECMEYWASRGDIKEEVDNEILSILKQKFDIEPCYTCGNVIAHDGVCSRKGGTLIYELEALKIKEVEV